MDPVFPPGLQIAVTWQSDPRPRLGACGRHGLAVTAFFYVGPCRGLGDPVKGESRPHDPRGRPAALSWGRSHGKGAETLPPTRNRPPRLGVSCSSCRNEVAGSPQCLLFWFPRRRMALLSQHLGRWLMATVQELLNT